MGSALKDSSHTGKVGREGWSHCSAHPVVGLQDTGAQPVRQCLFVAIMGWKGGVGELPE